MKRRHFIADIGRWSLFSGLIATSGVLAYRHKHGDPENCAQNPFCKSCNQYSDCSIVNISKPEKNEKAS
jgi:hypothetical protein